MLNILDVTLLFLTFLIVFVGSLITNYEKHLPISLIKLYRHGSYGCNTPAGKLFQLIELPKSYYRHFYVFSTVFSFVTLLYMLMVYLQMLQMNKYVKAALEGIYEQNEPAVSGKAAVIALTLFTLHCARRCWESHFLQIFSSVGKINVLHYAAALVHYTIVVLGLVGRAPMFCGNDNLDSVWMDTRPKMLYVSCILLFLLACYEQHRSNLILVNLRKSKHNETVVTEAHRIPYGRMFEKISSPHRLTEIILYFVMATLIPTTTMWIMCFWVFCNQIQSSIHAHEWYKKTFRDYPRNRDAIFPYIL